jgi:hypothetical protein
MQAAGGARERARSRRNRGRPRRPPSPPSSPSFRDSIQARHLTRTASSLSNRSSAAAARPSPSASGAAPRRSLLQWFGGGRGNSQTASLLGTLNAQSAVNIASSDADPWRTMQATQSAQRSAIAGTYGNTGERRAPPRRAAPRRAGRRPPAHAGSACADPPPLFNTLSTLSDTRTPPRAHAAGYNAFQSNFDNGLWAPYTYSPSSWVASRWWGRR